jgi:hypothetical protein
MKVIHNELRRHRFSSGVVLVLLIGTSAFAECPVTSDAQPARLIENEVQSKMIAGLVSRWKTDEPVRIMKFGAYVSKTGRFEGACCMSSGHLMSEVASQRLGQKLERLKFVPASYMGERVRVNVGFTIIARKTPDGVQTEVLLNHLYSMDKFGINYSAPQRVWSKSMWAGRRLSSPVYFEVLAKVDLFGNATDAKVNDKGSNSGAVDGAMLGRIESACFIPGFHNGEATEMLYSEAFGNW